MIDEQQDPYQTSLKELQDVLSLAESVAKNIDTLNSKLMRLYLGLAAGAGSASFTYLVIPTEALDGRIKQLGQERLMAMAVYLTIALITLAYYAFRTVAKILREIRKEEAVLRQVVLMANDLYDGMTFESKVEAVVLRIRLERLRLPDTRTVHFVR